MAKKTLNQCAEPGQVYSNEKQPYATNCEDVAQFKSCEGIENLHHAPNASFEGIDQDTMSIKEGLGEPSYCDPMVKGTIFEEPGSQKLPSDRSVIYRYSKGYRAIDEAVFKLFQNINVSDERGKIFRVPIIWGTQERAVAVILQNNVRKDNTGVVDRIVLPAMSIYTSEYNFPRERYIWHYATDYKRGKRHYNEQGNPLGSVNGSPSWTHKESRHPDDTVLGHARGIPVDQGYTLTIWSRFLEDMNQILEQIATKFNPLAYINVQGVTNWENTVRIDSVSNNTDTEPGDMNKRVVKFQVNLTAESYIPQPIIRRKSVLKVKTEILDSITDQDIANVIGRIEEVVGEN